MTPEEYKKFGKYKPNLSNSEMIKNRYKDLNEFENLLREALKTPEKPAGIASKVINTASAPIETPNKNILEEMSKMSRASKAAKVAKGIGAAAGPAAAVVTGITDVDPALTGYVEKTPGAGPAEAALSPEGSKAIAGMLGSEVGSAIGARIGSMSPVAKVPATIAGATMGGMAGYKLGQLLTGVPAVDKLIKQAYESEVKKRKEKQTE